VPMQVAGIIVNLSVGGALVAVKKPPGERGQNLTIKFKVVVNGVEALLELKAVIRAINEDHTGETDSAYQLGLQFLDVAAQDTIPMLAFVYHQLLEHSLGA